MSNWFILNLEFTSNNVSNKIEIFQTFFCIKMSFFMIKFQLNVYNFAKLITFIFGEWIKKKKSNFSGQIGFDIINQLGCLIKQFGKKISKNN